MAVKNHIDNWIAKAEPDYYTMFIKAWIPLNAWYVVEYNTTSDSEAIGKLKDSKNKIRNRIEALLTNPDNESKNFRHHLSQLHFQLESRTILNHGAKVSFSLMLLDGFFPSAVTDTDKKGNVYKAIPNKTTGYRAVIVAKGGKSLMDKTFNPYSISDFLTDTQYVSLGDRKLQEKIRICFENINPKRPINLVSNSSTKSDYILLDADSKIKFINDTELIAKSLIQIFYTLRCVLFHGTLDPTDSNQKVYEHAFHLLMAIIKELK